MTLDKSAIRKWVMAAERDHPSAQLGLYRLRKSIIDGSDLISGPPLGGAGHLWVRAKSALF